MAKDEYAPLTEQTNSDESISSNDEVRYSNRTRPIVQILWPWVLHGALIIGYSLGAIAVIKSQCNIKKWESNERNEIYCEYTP